MTHMGATFLGWKAGNCEPEQIEVRNPRAPGRQIFIRGIPSVTAEPTRGWDEKEATTKIVFA